MRFQSQDRSPAQNIKVFLIMKPALFLLAVTGVSIFISYHISREVTWLTYYVGALAGLVVGGSALGYWNKRRRVKEAEEAKARTKRKW